MTPQPTTETAPPLERLARYPLLDALRGRRSRRFGLGMKIERGPFAYASGRPPRPLGADEEAALAFAACGVTGYVLADLAYGRGRAGRCSPGCSAGPSPAPTRSTSSAWW